MDLQLRLARLLGTGARGTSFAALRGVLPKVFETVIEHHSPRVVLLDHARREGFGALLALPGKPIGHLVRYLGSAISMESFNPRAGLSFTEQSHLVRLFDPARRRYRALPEVMPTVTLDRLASNGVAFLLRGERLR